MTRRTAAAALAGALAFTLSCATATTPSAATRAPRERTASVDGIRVRYRDAGQGARALVFVHGWASELGVWAAEEEYFAPKTRVITIDLPGHGASDKPRTAYSIDLFARAVEGVLGDAGVTKAVLVGHSMGTPVVRQVWRRRPETVEALVVVDGMLRAPFTDANPEALEKFVAPLESGGEEALASFADSMMSHATPEARAAVKRSMSATPAYVRGSAMRGAFAASVWKDDHITVPVLLVLAESPFWSKEYLAYVAELAPRSEVHVLKETGHYVMLEKPGELNALLDSFLARQLLP